VYDAQQMESAVGVQGNTLQHTATYCNTLQQQQMESAVGVQGMLQRLSSSPRIEVSTQYLIHLLIIYNTY